MYTFIILIVLILIVCFTPGKKIFRKIDTQMNIISEDDVEYPYLVGASEQGDLGRVSPSDVVTDNINLIAQAMYPVGSVYINGSTTTNPSILFGFGEWQRYATGRVMIGIDSSDSDFDTLEETGGEKEHTLTTDEMPAHTHNYEWTQSGRSGENVSTGFLAGLSQNTQGAKTKILTSTGGDGAHNNLQPYIVVSIWIRIR